MIELVKREDYSSVKEAREAYKAAISANLEEARRARGAMGAMGAYKAATSVNPAKEYLRYMQPTEEELRAILKAVKEDCAPNSEIKKTTIGGEVRKTILIADIYQADIYQIGNYEIKIEKSDGIDLYITIYNIPDRILIQ